MQHIPLQPNPEAFVQSGLDHHGSLHESWVQRVVALAAQLPQTGQHIVRMALSGLFHVHYMRVADTYRELAASPTLDVLERVSDVIGQERLAYQQLLEHVQALVEDRQELIETIRMDAEIELHKE